MFASSNTLAYLLMKTNKSIKFKLSFIPTIRSMIVYQILDKDKNVCQFKHSSLLLDEDEQKY